MSEARDGRHRGFGVCRRLSRENCRGNQDYGRRDPGPDPIAEAAMNRAMDGQAEEAAFDVIFKRTLQILTKG